jgi:hypothetical protein
MELEPILYQTTVYLVPDCGWKHRNVSCCPVL